MKINCRSIGLVCIVVLLSVFCAMPSVYSAANRVQLPYSQNFETDSFNVTGGVASADSTETGNYYLFGASSMTWSTISDSDTAHGTVAMLTGPASGGSTTYAGAVKLFPKISSGKLWVSFDIKAERNKEFHILLGTYTATLDGWLTENSEISRRVLTYSSNNISSMGNVAISDYSDGVWYHNGILVDMDNKKISTYVNGSQCYTGDFDYNNITYESIARIGFYIRNGGTLLIDNLNIETIDNGSATSNLYYGDNPVYSGYVENYAGLELRIIPDNPINMSELPSSEFLSLVDLGVSCIAKDDTVVPINVIPHALYISVELPYELQSENYYNLILSVQIPLLNGETLSSTNWEFYVLPEGTSAISSVKVFNNFTGLSSYVPTTSSDISANENNPTHWRWEGSGGDYYENYHITPDSGSDYSDGEGILFAGMMSLPIAKHAHQDKLSSGIIEIEARMKLLDSFAPSMLTVSLIPLDFMGKSIFRSFITTDSSAQIITMTGVSASETNTTKSQIEDIFYTVRIIVDLDTKQIHFYHADEGDDLTLFSTKSLDDSFEHAFTSIRFSTLSGATPTTFVLDYINVIYTDKRPGVTDITALKADGTNAVVNKKVSSDTETLNIEFNMPMSMSSLKYIKLKDIDGHIVPYSGSYDEDTNTYSMILNASLRDKGVYELFIPETVRSRDFSKALPIKNIFMVESPFRAETIEFNKNGNPVTMSEISTGDILTASALFHNESGENQNAILVLAVYKDTQMVDMAWLPVSVSASEEVVSKELSYTIENNNFDCFKAFLCYDTEPLTSMISPIILE